MGIRAKLDALNVFPFHVVAVGQAERFTKLVPIGALPAMLVPSADISYRRANKSYLGAPLGTKQDIDMRNWVSVPVVPALKT